MAITAAACRFRQNVYTLYCRCTVAVHSCVLRMSTSSVEPRRPHTVGPCMSRADSGQTRCHTDIGQQSRCHPTAAAVVEHRPATVQPRSHPRLFPSRFGPSSYQLPSNAVAGDLFATAAEQKKVKRDFKRDFEREQQVQQMSSRLSRPTSLQRQMCSSSGENHERQEAQQFHYPPSSASKSMASITASLGQYMKECVESKLQKSGFKPISREASLGPADRKYGHRRRSLY